MSDEPKLLRHERQQWRLRQGVGREVRRVLHAGLHGQGVRRRRLWGELRDLHAAGHLHREHLRDHDDHDYNINYNINHNNHYNDTTALRRESLPILQRYV